MLLNILSTSFICFALSAGVQASPFFVDHGFQGESPTGESWMSAFPSLQSAIDAADETGGGDIWMKAGVYMPEGANRNATFELKPNVSIYGGFRGGETNLVQRNPKINRTVLSGDIGKIGSTRDNSYHVLTAATECRLDSLIISRGNANSAAENRFGGGLRIPPNVHNVVVANCIFEKNNAETGGAILVEDGSLTVTNCTFFSNSAEDGGAISTQGKSILNIKKSNFSSNFSPTSGGALSVETGAQATISDTSFIYNSTDGNGGAISARTEEDAGIGLKLTNCSFSENSARTTGGALAFSGTFTPVITECSFNRNFSRKGAGALANMNGTVAVVIDSTYVENRGIKGAANMANDATSSITDSMDSVVKSKTASTPEETVSTPKPAVTPEPIAKRSLPDVFVYNTQHQKVK
ncbi:MAG: hypothetical protein OES84_03200, partial [Kiritimatiellaceae bacterium]|nr:hypothetical protein [Kiritimatiellaceae bacterium]